MPSRPTRVSGRPTACCAAPSSAARCPSVIHINTSSEYWQQRRDHPRFGRAEPPDRRRAGRRRAAPERAHVPRRRHPARLVAAAAGRERRADGLGAYLRQHDRLQAVRPGRRRQPVRLGHGRAPSRRPAVSAPRRRHAGRPATWSASGLPRLPRPAAAAPRLSPSARGGDGLRRGASGAPGAATCARPGPGRRRRRQRGRRPAPSRRQRAAGHLYRLEPAASELAGARQLLVARRRARQFRSRAPARANRAASDPRPSIEERYASRGAFLERVRCGRPALVEERYLLADDVDELVQRGRVGATRRGIHAATGSGSIHIVNSRSYRCERRRASE